MFKQSIALSFLLTGLITVPSFAQSMQYDPSGTRPFIETSINPTDTTNGLQPSQAEQITGVYVNPLDRSGASVVNGLAPTTMDSFVYEAGGNAELIYGDEGTNNIPPYFGFDNTHRIIDGITGTRSQGLTTGHGSYLPSAWGGDEFGQTYPQEWAMSGSTMPSAPGTLNILGGTVQIPNVNIPGMPGGLQSVFGGTSGIGSGLNSGNFKLTTGSLFCKDCPCLIKSAPSRSV
jgi:hypothetical protein